ncbi:MULTISPECIES: hypothetical protein [Pseudoalteromonas]|uniref:Uncharacterized protein n=1 Tax=Pseudoalteromonas luteoviolacea (strain 2ta16) TaxID=1353533 RepID=V4HUC5_PSEL2|nr:MULTISPECIES: hypothetical protein [Pseudoalteromonas]ESP91519.1 hypothetical protein PL2TA16_00318 [Pseudoalteromonas luteoviolacea 2ta16]KZN40169.1 hypothetical protein N483_18440 [Pseudoalteromonas luteoviolacea NCIMB 1944]MCG7549252.1 hypothetical protein [Pseudoalteromonas sp. Of7M-16]
MQSVVFIFEFSTLIALRGAFKKVHERTDFAEKTVKELGNGRYQLRITKLIKLNEENIEKHRTELTSDVKGYGGSFVSWKVHKVVSGNNIDNKKVSNTSKLLYMLTTAGDARTYRQYKVPLFSILFTIVLFLVLSFVGVV